MTQPAASSTSTAQWLNRLRMRHVALLLAIDERRTLHAAARELGMTQPAATKMLHDLEDSLGEKLFERIGRGLQINAAGQAVINTFRSLRNNMTALGRELRELRLGSAGKLVVGSIMVATPTHLSAALISLKRLYPLLAIEVVIDTSDRLIEMLHGGQLDLVIGRLPEAPALADDDCVFRPLGDEAIALIAARDHPLFTLRQRGPIQFAALLAYPWILQPRGSPSREVIEQEFRSHHAPLPPGLIETTSILVASNLIERSAMITAIPQSIADHYQQHGLLRILPYSFTHTLTAWGSLVHRERAISPIAQQFLELLHADASALNANTVNDVATAISDNVRYND